MANAPAAVPETFAVVIATRNRREQVIALLEKLASMRGAADEVIVVDDGSDDGTPGAVRSSGLAAVVVDGSGDGPASARNLGVESVSATWIAFIDDDDEPDPEWMESLRELSRQHPAASYLSVGYRDIRPDGAVHERGVLVNGPTFSNVTGNWLAGTFAIRADLFREVGGFTRGLRNMEFTDLAIRVFDAMARHGLEAVSDRTTRLSLIGRPTSHRSSQSPAALIDAVERTADHLTPFWQREPSFLADQLATGGVAAARAGRFDLARRWLAGALRANPRPASLLRMVVVMVPPVARRVWPPFAESDRGALT